jgi:hypothetical protein
MPTGGMDGLTFLVSSQRVMLIQCSFRTERYFGKNRKQVRETREVPTGKIDWLPAILMRE